VGNWGYGVGVGFTTGDDVADAAGVDAAGVDETMFPMPPKLHAEAPWLGPTSA